MAINCSTQFDQASLNSELSRVGVTLHGLKKKNGTEEGSDDTETIVPEKFMVPLCCNSAHIFSSHIIG